MKLVIEGLLFASPEAVKIDRMADILESERGQVQHALQEMMADYGARPRGFVLEEVAGGVQLRTRPEHGEWIRRLNRTRPLRFSRAAMETLAIIAYRQPATRAEIEYLRGVDSGSVVKTLLDRRLIRILGKKDVAGKPLIYGTTKEFLTLFGLRDLGALPTLKEFSELAGEGEARPEADGPSTEKKGTE